MTRRGSIEIDAGGPDGLTSDEAGEIAHWMEQGLNYMEALRLVRAESLYDPESLALHYKAYGGPLNTPDDRSPISSGAARACKD